MKKLKEGDLVELVDTPGGYYHSLERTRSLGDGQVGIVTRIINPKMTPSLVEVTWGSGISVKYYSDDLIVLESKKD